MQFEVIVMYYYAHCRHNEDICGHKHRSARAAGRCADKKNISVAKYNPGCYGTWEIRRSDNMPLDLQGTNQVFQDLGLS